jgi:hypothetical protein
MATHDTRIERLAQEILTERNLPTECDAIFDPHNTLTEVRLGAWASGMYKQTKFMIDTDGGNDSYDRALIIDALARLLRA